MIQKNNRCVINLKKNTVFKLKHYLLDLFSKQGNISLMKKIILLFLVFIFLPTPLNAKSVEDDRRIEEEKRESLRQTETNIFPERQFRPENDEPIEFDYFRELISRKIALNSDACKVIAILIGLEEHTKDFSSQITLLKDRDIIPQKIAMDFEPSQPLTKGVAAYMFCRALKIKGGIWLRLLGMSQRYSLKELVFEGIMFPGSVNDIMSGKELILVFTRAVEYATARIEGA